MQEINIDTWRRKEHFNFFRNVAYPLYNICFDMDITNLLDFTKANNLSLNLVLVYFSTKALNDIENFRYRLRKDKVILHEILTPSFAHIDKGSDLFKMVTVEMCTELIEFVQSAKDKAENQKEYFKVQDFINRDDFVFYSAIPWISFTSIDHTINMKQEDAIPRISWGKYYSRDNKVLLPYNIQVNHMFVDGIHLGMFKDKLEELINSQVLSDKNFIE